MLYVCHACSAFLLLYYFIIIFFFFHFFFPRRCRCCSLCSLIRVRQGRNPMQIIAYKISIYSLFTSCSVPFDVRRACISHIETGALHLRQVKTMETAKKKNEWARDERVDECWCWAAVGRRHPLRRHMKQLKTKIRDNIAIAFTCIYIARRDSTW